MPGSLLPLFPLSVVLLPSTPLPLHIFEERYKEMMGVLIPERGEFGVVLAKDGGVVNIGCTATVEEVVKRYPDGRLDLITMGRRRFRIVGLDEERSYLRADVEFFNDDDATPPPPALQEQAIHAAHRLQSIQNEKETAVPKMDEPFLSFQIAQLVDDLDYRQALLVMRSETERLNYLVQSLPRYTTQREQVNLARRVAPQNGHAKQFQAKYFSDRGESA